MRLNTPYSKPAREDGDATTSAVPRPAAGRRGCTERLRRMARRNAWDLYAEHFY